MALWIAMACAGVQEKPYRRLIKPRRPYPKPTQVNESTRLRR